MPSILGRAARLPVHSPADGDPLLAGHIYVAPPDGVSLEDSGGCASPGPRPNGHRPAIDATMRSAALAYDGGASATSYSGSRDDGTAGLLAIKEHGGRSRGAGPRRGAIPRDAA